MPNINKVTIMGHLVRDADLRYTNGGDPVTNITLAVNRTFGDDTDFIDVTIWNRGNYKAAEYCAEYEKGDLVLIHGELRQDRWEDNNGNSRSKIKVRSVKEVNFSQSRDNSGDEEFDDEDDLEQEKPQKNMSDDFETPF